mmetsp:Transcript_27886/g.89527  ORF Transcript_27886/g.89527 Transcript_27886/m.89527 type:complete len:208 (+) Transcript_27886:342-965(+)
MTCSAERGQGCSLRIRHRQGARRCLANGFRPNCSCPAPRARSSCRPRAAAGRASLIGSRGGASTTRCATAAHSPGSSRAAPSSAAPSSAAPSPTFSPPWRTAASYRWPSLGRRSGCSATPSLSGWASSSSRARSSSSSARRRPPSCTAQQSGKLRRSSGTRTLSARSRTPQARTWATTRLSTWAAQIGASSAAPAPPPPASGAPPCT